MWVETVDGEFFNVGNVTSLLTVTEDTGTNEWHVSVNDHLFFKPGFVTEAEAESARRKMVQAMGLYEL